MQVYVVTGLDMGWDCVVGVFTVENDEEYAQLQKIFAGDNYCIFEQTVQKFDLADYVE